jgi:hypothetical protein
MKSPTGNQLSLGAVLAVLPLLSCSFLVDADRVQCSQDSDCTKRGGAFANTRCAQNFCEIASAWSCLDTKRTPSGSGPFAVTVPGVADVVSQQPILGATISVCRKLDVACSNPVDSQIAQSAGGVTFTIESGFTGYLQAEVSGYLPSLYFFNPTVDRDQTIALIPVASQMEYAGLLSAIGVSPDPSRGSAVLLAYDCTDKTAAGISFSSPNSDDQSKSFYYSEGLPSSFATATDTWGYGGISNLPAGAVSVNARLASTGANLPTVSLLVRPMVLSFAQIVPYAN